MTKLRIKKKKADILVEKLAKEINGHLRMNRMYK